MKQKEFFGKGEKHVYVRKGDKGEILVTKTKHEELITEENTVHLDAEEARKLGIQLLKLGTEPLEGEYVINKNEEAREFWENNGLEPNFDIEGESLEKLIALLAKIV